MFAIDEHVEVEATWGIYQQIVAAYREPDKGGALSNDLRVILGGIMKGIPCNKP